MSGGSMNYACWKVSDIADMEEDPIIKDLLSDLSDYLYEEEWYQFCMLCKYAYTRKDDADAIYCSAPKWYCPHKKEIEDAERDE